MTARDPGVMSVAERIEEVATIFAIGFMRRISSRRLDLIPGESALSGLLNGRRTTPRKEPA